MRPGRDCQRGGVPAPSLTPRGSATQLRPSHNCDHPDPHVGQPRQPLLPNQDRRGKDTTRGRALPEETPRRPPLADHDHRRTTAGGEPGRTSGSGSAIQRGWLNPNNQHFGQVTSQTRQQRLYDDQASRLTNTEAPDEPVRGPVVQAGCPQPNASWAARTPLFRLTSLSSPGAATRSPTI